MILPAGSNARLTAVTESALLTDHALQRQKVLDGQEPDAPTVIWTGDCQAYVPASLNAVTMGQQRDQDKTLTVQVPCVREIKPGMIITISYDGAEYQLTIQSATKVGLLPGVPSYYNLEIEVK